MKKESDSVYKVYLNMDSGYLCSVFKFALWKWYNIIIFYKKLFLKVSSEM